MAHNALKLVMALAASCIIFVCCEEPDDGTSEKFRFLTGTTWVSDSLLADGVRADGPGGILEKFRGETKFNPDSTCQVGQYAGTWHINSAGTLLTIHSESLPAATTATIDELTAVSLKISAVFPVEGDTAWVFHDVRMTFRAK